jgi:hypothetical protein
MHRGYVKIWRKIKDSGLYQLPETFTLFMFILTESTHQPRRIGNTLLQRGQYSLGRIELARQLKQSEQTVRTGLKKLEKLEILTIETTSHGSVYTIVNYNLYQVNEGEANQQLNQPLTSDQPAANQPLTSDQPHNKHINTKHINTEEHKQKPTAEYSAGFLKFWETWPYSKRKGAQGKCWDKWLSKKLESKIDEIISHIEYRESNGDFKDQQFIEAPLVYLNGAKWEGASINIFSEQPWHTFWSGIEAKAKELKIEKLPDEPPLTFRSRVYEAAGITA